MYALRSEKLVQLSRSAVLYGVETFRIIEDVRLEAPVHVNFHVSRIGFDGSRVADEGDSLE